jgi:uncharacterized membrane protein
VAGIGFELRRLLRRDSYLGYLQAYGAAGLVSSGPWVMSIVSVLIIGMCSAGAVPDRIQAEQFLVSVTALMAASLLFTSPLQLMFSRFVADRAFARRDDEILPNVLGALTLVTNSGGAVAMLLLPLFRGAPPGYPQLMVVTFVVLCDLWIVVLLLSGLKAYRQVLASFALGNVASVAGALLLRHFGLAGLLGGFAGGQTVMFFVLLRLVILAHPSASGLVSFAFLRPSSAHYDLALTGVLFNFGIWADKLAFWANPETSRPVIGPLRSSILYDLPIFIAYLSIVPGMAVFLLRIETDFVEEYDAFFRAIREGATLTEIREIQVQLVAAVRQGLYDILKLQGLTVVVLLLAGPKLLELAGISRLYVHLLNVDVVGVALQVLLLALLSVLFYLDRRGTALAVTAVFALANCGLTILSQALGPEFYGYGFAGAAFLACLLATHLLTQRLARLDMETFMQQA